MTDLSRRSALGCIAGMLAHASTANRKPVVAGHIWVYAAPQPGYDPTPALETAFADLSAAGIEAIELMERALRHDDALRRIGRLSREHNLPVIGSSWDGPTWDRARHAALYEDAEIVVDRLGRLGGRHLGVSVGDAKRRKTDAELDAQAEFLRGLDSICRANGVQMNLHNHIYEVQEDEYDLKGTLARIPDAKLGPDLDWLTGAKVNPVDFIRRHGKRLVYLHLRDRRKDGVWSEAMGEGAIDYVAIGKALREVGFSGDVAIELAHPKDFKPTRPLRDSWKMSREYVRKTLGF